MTIITEIPNLKKIVLVSFFNDARRQMPNILRYYVSEYLTEIWRMHLLLLKKNICCVSYMRYDGSKNLIIIRFLEKYIRHRTRRHRLSQFSLTRQ